MPFSIREAKTADARLIVDAYQWLFEPPGSVPPSWDEDAALQAVTETIESGTSVIFVAIASADSKLAGICSAYLDLRSVRYGPRCWVEDLAVAPAMRSKGIGGDLLDQAEAWAEERGATHLELDTGEQRADSRRFYEARDPDQRTVAYGWRLGG